MIILVIMMISLSVMMIILRSWWWLARKKHENEKPLGADSVEYWSLQRSGENGIFFLRTISNISYNSNTKNQNIFRYFHKSQITICFLQTITNILNNSKIKSCNIFATKISRKVFRNKFSSGETVYVGTKAVCGKNHKRASTAYGCKYNHQNVIIDVPT